MANPEGIFSDIFRAYYDQIIIGRLMFGIGVERIAWNDPTAIEEKPREENMTQMQPKDILVHLEKGDRTDEFVEPRSPAVDMSDPLNQLFNTPMFISNQQANQMNQIQQSQLGNAQRRLGMASAQLSNSLGLGGGSTW